MEKGMLSQKILKRLIAADTVNPPGREGSAALLLKQILEPYGLRCEIQDLGEERANFIGEAKAAPGPELMLCGHLDVVPAYGTWTWDPFHMEARNGRIYGRGSCDMKGGIAAMCEAAIRILRRGGPLRGSLKLLFVADEECSNLGMKSYLKAHGWGDYAVIGEPTGMEIAAAHRGVARDYIDIYGEARHAALSDHGDHSAIVKSATAIEAFKSMNRELSERRHELLPPPGISITMIKAYEKDNVIPGRARLLTDFRILPGMGREEAESFIRNGLLKAGLDKVEVSSHFYMPGGEIPLSDPYLKKVLEVRSGISNKAHVPVAFDASCEQCFLSKAGIKTVICGPGSISLAHAADEYIEYEQLQLAVEFYEALIGEFLGVGGVKENE